MVEPPLAVMLSSCATRTHSDHDGDTFDWKHADPLGFLEFLKAKQGEPCPTFAVEGVPDTWVTKEHIPQLMELLDSDEPCANVHSVYSSFHDCRKSTIGNEAAFLVEGFRTGRYPPEMNSGRYQLNGEKIRRVYE